MPLHYPISALLGLYLLNIPIRCQHIPQSLDTLVSTCLIGIQNTTLPQNTSVGFECETISEFSHSASRSYRAGSRSKRPELHHVFQERGCNCNKCSPSNEMHANNTALDPGDRVLLCEHGRQPRRAKMCQVEGKKRAFSTAD